MSRANPKQAGFRRLFAAGLGAFLPLAAALAQNTETEGEEDEIFTLTPFEVEAEEDTGYRATNTLAGTRMRMSLDDVGTSVSVFTEQLMEDLAAVDNETLLAFGLGTEVGGARGNFVNADEEGLENDNLFTPQSNTRIRGLARADNTRNFFKSDVPWDGYNTSRVDVQRGANSILFGLGSPAGIINNTTTKAGFKNEGELQLRYDQFGSLRASLDYNQVLLEDELAIRLSLLRDSKEFRQEPAFEDDERIFTSIVYQPKLLNTESITTSFSANFEHGDIDANRPRFVIPLDHVSPFFIPEGENGFQGPEFANGAKYGPRDPLSGNAGQTRNQITDAETIDNNPFLGLPSSSGSNPTFIFDAQTPGRFSAREDGINSRGSFVVREDVDDDGNIIDRTVVRNVGFDAPFQRDDNDQDGDGITDEPLFVRDIQENINGVKRLTTGGKGSAAAAAGLPFQGFWRDASFASPEQFDFFNNLIDGNNKLEQQEFDVFEFQVRNTFLNDRVGYQLSYFKQEMDIRQDARLGAVFAPAIKVDAGELDSLSDDLDNPNPNTNAGRAFIDFELRLRGGREEIRDRSERQVQVFATLDARDFMEDGLATRLVGKHDFSALVKERRFERLRREFNASNFDEAYFRQRGSQVPNFENPDPGPGSRAIELAQAFGGVQPRVRVFLDAPGENLTQIQPFAAPALPSGPVEVEGFLANPVPGFTAQDALAEWITPIPDFDSDEQEFVVDSQANNPANYVGRVQSVGAFNFVNATDSREALEFLTTRRFFNEEDVDSHALIWTGRFWDGAVVGMYGWREDEVEQFDLEHDFGSDVEDNDATRGFTGGPIFDPSSPFRRESAGKFQSRNWSVKANVTKLFNDLTGISNDWAPDWMPVNVSVLFNRGEVQNPQPGRRDVFLNDLPPSTGKTIDRSVVLSSKDNKYSLRITKFDVDQKRAAAGNPAVSQNFRIEQIFSQAPFFSGQIEQRNGDWVSPDLPLSAEAEAAGFDSEADFRTQVVAPAFRELEDGLYNILDGVARPWFTDEDFSPGQQTRTSVSFPDDTVFTEDQSSFGLEFEFFAQPTENWNLTVNASKVTSVRDQIFSDDLNQVLDFIVEGMAGPAGNLPMWCAFCGTFNGNSIRDWIAPFTGQLISVRATEGASQPEIRKWRVNVITNYDFNEGFLDGFGAGVAFRYEDEATLGFQPIIVDSFTGERLDDPGTSGAALAVDLDQPFTDSARETFDVWLKYKRKLTDRIDWRIQLNFFNVFNDREAVPLFVNPDGSVGSRGIREGRSWQLTNTFEF